MIANGLVRGALPALGQLKTPATIPHSHRRGKEFRHRSFQAGGQPARVLRKSGRVPQHTRAERRREEVERQRWQEAYERRKKRLRRAAFPVIGSIGAAGIMMFMPLAEASIGHHLYLYLSAADPAVSGNPDLPHTSESDGTYYSSLIQAVSRTTRISPETGTWSALVRWCPSLSAAIVTQLVTRLWVRGQTGPLLVRHCQPVGYRRSPGKLPSRVTRPIGECRMPLWSTLVVSAWRTERPTCRPQSLDFAPSLFIQGCPALPLRRFPGYVDDQPALLRGQQAG